MDNHSLEILRFLVLHHRNSNWFSIESILHEVWNQETDSIKQPMDAIKWLEKEGYLLGGGVIPHGNYQLSQKAKAFIDDLERQEKHLEKQLEPLRKMSESAEDQSKSAIEQVEIAKQQVTEAKRRAFWANFIAVISVLIALASLLHNFLC